jgi:hypothetical protein
MFVQTIRSTQQRASLQSDNSQLQGDLRRYPTDEIGQVDVLAPGSRERVVVILVEQVLAHLFQDHGPIRSRA